MSLLERLQALVADHQGDPCEHLHRRARKLAQEVAGPEAEVDLIYGTDGRVRVHLYGSASDHML